MKPLCINTASLNPTTGEKCAIWRLTLSSPSTPILMYDKYTSACCGSTFLVTHPNIPFFKCTHQVWHQNIRDALLFGDSLCQALCNNSHIRQVCFDLLQTHLPCDSSKYPTFQVHASSVALRYKRCIAIWRFTVSATIHRIFTCLMYQHCVTKSNNW